MSYIFVWLLGIFLFFMATAALIPTTKEACAIYMTPKIVNMVDQNEELKSIPTNIVNLAHQWIKELEPNKE